MDDFFDLATEENDNIPRVNELIKTILIYGRKLNIDLWVVSQSAFNTSKFILDNASTIVRFKTGAISDKCLNQLMPLSTSEEKLFGLFKTGCCLFLRKSVCPKPIPVYVPFFPLGEISDDERNAIMEPRISQMKQNYLKVFKDQSENNVHQQEPIIELDADKIHILKDIAISPYESITERSIKLGYSTPTLVRHLKTLEEQGYIKQIPVNLGKGIGIIKLSKLEEKAIALVGKQKLVGRGSIVHGFWMITIQKYFENQQYQVELEKFIEEVNGLIDVAISKDKIKVVAIEIALSNKYEHECENIQKCLRAGFSKVISTAPSELILKGIKQEVFNKNIDLNCVEFKLLKEFYDDLHTTRPQSR